EPLVGPVGLGPSAPEVERHGRLDVVPRVAVAAGEPRDHPRWQLPLCAAANRGLGAGGRDQAGDVGRDVSAWRSGLRAYTARLCPRRGLSSRSVHRVMVPMGWVWAMSHTGTFRYACTSGLSSLVGPTAHLSHQYGECKA